MEAAVLRCDGELAMRKGDNERSEECFIRSKDWPLLEMLYLTSGQHDKLAAIINGINFSALNELAIGDASERTMALEQAGRPVLAYLNAVAYMSCGVNPDAVRLLTQLSAASTKQLRRLPGRQEASLVDCGGGWASGTALGS